MRTRILFAVAFVGLVCGTIASGVDATDAAKPIRAGIIGLDTGHAVEFTRVLNDPNAPADVSGVTVVAAYPGGSADVDLSRQLLKGNTDTVRGLGVVIVDSIDELLKRVDVVLLESIDGRPHLAQARPVIAAGKPLFVDKPLAASLADAMEIFRLAKAKNVPCFSASSLRFSRGFQAVRSGTAGFGDVRGCTAWSPMYTEPHHPELFWYGIHGVEILFTVMGPGCESVAQVAPDKVLGVWKGGRRGVFVAKEDFGATVEGTQKTGEAGKWDGYRPLVVEIVEFFKTGKSPVSAEETLEIIAFMEAAGLSKEQGGKAVAIADVMKEADSQTANTAKKTPGKAM